MNFSRKKIEEEEGLLVDFANENIGGGSLSKGMVQEEIMFATCPELYVSIAICEKMMPNESISISGFRRLM